jgi:hypothetical protein
MLSVCRNCFLVQLERFETLEHIFGDHVYVSFATTCLVLDSHGLAAHDLERPSVKSGSLRVHASAGRGAKSRVPELLNSELSDGLDKLEIYMQHSQVKSNTPSARY